MCIRDRAKVSDATIDELLDNLKLPEYRTRYRTKRELRGRNSGEVLAKLKTWVANLKKDDPQYTHHVLEALWVTWGLNNVNEGLLKQMLESKDFRARAAAVRVVRYSGHQLKNQADLLMLSLIHISSGMAYICPLASMGSPVMAYVFVLHKKQEVL